MSAPDLGLTSYEEAIAEVLSLRAILADVWREVGPGYPRATDLDSYLPAELVDRIAAELGERVCIPVIQPRRNAE